MPTPDQVAAAAEMLEDLQVRLQTRALGRRAEYHASIDSTNRRGLVLAGEGAPAGTLVLADHQTAGRGRRGRAWQDASGENLLLSVILRPRLAPDRLGLIPIAAGVAVAEAVDRHIAPLAASLKWPNDVMIGGRKVSGVLAESKLAGLNSVVVLGVGLNVHQVSFPSDLADTATSLRLVTGRTIDRVELLADLLLSLERWIDVLDTGHSHEVRSAFQERIDSKEVSVAGANGEWVSGRVDRLADDGALVLVTRDGEQMVHAGEVSHSGSEAQVP